MNRNYKLTHKKAAEISVGVITFLFKNWTTFASIIAVLVIFWGSIVKFILIPGFAPIVRPYVKQYIEAYASPYIERLEACEEKLNQ